MKAKFLYIVFAGIILFSTCPSCDRIESVDAPSFEVYSEKDIYQVGDSVKFTFSGDPDIISFYSGEMGNDYDYVNGRIAEPDYFINFETQSQNGLQSDQMRILVSADFNGDYSIEGVNTATWTDITDRFTMAPPSNGSAYMSSDLGSFKDLLSAASDTTTLYFAVKQNTLDQEVHGLGNLNRLRYFTITSMYETLNTKLYEHAGFGWTLFSTPNKQPGRAALENTYTIMMRNSWWRPGNNPDGIDYYRENTEDWAVSSPIAIPRLLDMGPDKSKSIKGINDVKLNDYIHIYNNPGVYKVVFKSINANVDSYKEDVKELTITVTN